MTPIQEAERRYPITRDNSNDENHRNVDRHVIWDEACNWLLSTLQVPVWVNAEIELPSEAGVNNSVCIEYEGKFYKGFKNFDDVNPKMYWEHAGKSYLTNEGVSWLKPEPLLPLLEAKKKIEELEREIVSLKDEILKLKQ